MIAHEKPREIAVDNCIIQLACYTYNKFYIHCPNHKLLNETYSLIKNEKSFDDIKKYKNNELYLLNNQWKIWNQHKNAVGYLCLTCFLNLENIFYIMFSNLFVMSYAHKIASCQMIADRINELNILDSTISGDVNSIIFDSLWLPTLDASILRYLQQQQQLKENYIKLTFDKKTKLLNYIDKIIDDLDLEKYIDFLIEDFIKNELKEN
jgi:hypothetical protein